MKSENQKAVNLLFKMQTPHVEVYKLVFATIFMQCKCSIKTAHKLSVRSEYLL